jgi:hypothetical protein
MFNDRILMEAKYYIYKNLHRNMFSIRHKGRVIEHARNVMVNDAVFKVSEAGRARVLKTKQKNVHAYVVADNYSIDIEEVHNLDHSNVKMIRYNPYLHGFFFDKDGNKVESAKKLLVTNQGLFSF